MRECDNLIHPFQHDPGVSQRQRVMDSLLSGSADIDGRTLADLLDYFMQLSRHINFYEDDLSVSDWQPFFKKSLPFTFATIIKFDSDSINEKLALYQRLFKKKPSSPGLQLLVHFIYYRLINPLNTWQKQTQGSELPVAFALEKLIKNKLQQTVKKFIRYSNTAVKWYCIKPVDWQRLYENEVWNLFPTDLHDSDDSFITEETTQRDRTIALYDAILELTPGFLDIMRLVSDAAASSMDQSLVPLKAELRETHQPHLALLFAFLKLFQHLQSDLNSFSKKHLDFFYKQVLQIKPKEATPDKAHIVFEIQNQIDSYLLKEGLLLKDGKDDNKAEVLFSLDDEIVVNKTQVVDNRTLFLNNQMVSDTTYVEGVYMAPDAGKADGTEKDFPEEDLQSFPTLGAKYSKYTDPEHGFIKPFPNARLGFILASPVLLLNEGKRTIEITLECKLKENICLETKISAGASSSCCEDDREQEIENYIEYPSFAASKEFYDRVKDSLTETYYYINRDLLGQAVKKGVSKGTVDKLNNLLIKQAEKEKLCYCPLEEKLYEITLPELDFKNEFSTDELKILKDIFPPRKVFNVLFSGEKEWLTASAPVDINFSPNHLPGSGEFVVTITTTLESDKPAVTFYGKEQLKEDFDTTLPLVKIELDDKIKIEYKSDDEEENEDSCCLERDHQSELDVSLYHFFRNVMINDTTIDVEVCGLKNFVVQNDESVQDVNAPIYPFGTRPDIIDYNIVNPSQVYCVTQEFIDDAVSAGISPAAKNHLESLISSSEKYEIGITDQDLDDFLNRPQLITDKITLEALFKDPAKNYCQVNLIGPNFYIGSHEVFCKQWQNVWLNINWKEKPNSFNDYYKAYVLRENGGDKIYGLDEKDFELNLAILEDGSWQYEQDNSKVTLNSKTNHFNRKLFEGELLPTICTQPNPVQQVIEVDSNFFNTSNLFKECKEIEEYKTDSLEGYIKLTLENQDFLHKEYPFVLARQMMALGRLPEVALEGAIYIEHPTNNIITFKGSILLINEILNDISAIETLSDTVRSEVQLIINRLNAAQDAFGPGGATITPAELNLIVQAIEDIRDSNSAIQLETDIDALLIKITQLQEIFSFFDVSGNVLKPLEVLIPNEPWTPIIKDMSIDYTARASITDIDLIHLYPYEGTYKPEELESQPTLLPTFCDEGTLFVGLKDLVPGSNVNMLFQLAEATADSESERENVHWFYLDNNQWKLLREGFEVLDDATDGLTTSGIIKFALPANMTSDNTILPTGLHWIKAAIPQNSRSVSETIGIHTQAVRVTFTNEGANDKMRLNKALPAGSVAKLKEADASVKKINQPYDSFGGRLPEGSGHFYTRTSELLRHKGRSIQKFDYERLALEAFPTLFKVKCINHSFGLNAHKYFNDFPVAPGYVLLAVIPDMNQLKASATFEPRAPVSLLENLRDYLRKRTSPFVRLKIMNPRYEKVHFCLKVKLYPGRDENFYKEKLMQDMREFLAPWAVGQYDKLTFGQCIYRSDIVRFLETRDYLDYILELKMTHQNQTGPPFDQQKVCPVTPRSILIAGDIDVCINQLDCEKWDDECYEHNRKVKVDCCDHEPIAVADYCKEPEIN